MRILKICQVHSFLVGIIMMAILLCCSSQVQAAQDGDYTYTVTADKATITSNIWARGDVTIPSTLGGFPVTSIGKWAFCNNDHITSISIPKGVTSIGESAFYRCERLTTISIPQGVTSIEKSTFYLCTDLTNISIPKGVTNIGQNAFQDCTGLTTINLPGVTNILDGAFYRCTGLTSISLPQGVNIGDYAFHGCKGLTSISIPQEVTYIGQGAFLGCEGLTSISIPQGVTSIGYGSFADCTRLTSIIVAADNLNYASIDGVLFNKAATKLLSCPGGLTSISIPQRVTSIEIEAFRGCRSLVTICLPQGVTDILGGAFDGCTGLTTINIPQGVTKIDYKAFNGCEGLTSIRFNSATTNIFDRADTIPVATKIISCKQSTANKYAKKYKRQFEVIGATTDVTVTGVMLKPTSSSEIDLSWNAVNGAKSYTIYRAISENGTYTNAGSAKKASFKNTKLKPSTSYWYKVTAVTTGGESGFSDIKTATTPPLTPSGVKAKVVSSTAVTLTWKAIAGSTFNVYRSTTQKVGYTKVAEDLNVAVYNDMNLTPGTNYWYYLIAVDSNGNESVPSSLIKALTQKAKG